MSWPVKRPRVIVGARAPLFDRLVDLAPTEPSEAHVERALTVEDVRLSVARELGRLFDTRCAFGLEEAAARTERTVLDYGIPDLGLRAPAEEAARTLLARAIRNAVAAFEPRLREPRVVVRQDPAEPGQLTAEITALLVVGDLVEPVAFRQSLRQAGEDDER